MNVTRCPHCQADLNLKPKPGTRCRACRNCGRMVELPPEPPESNTEERPLVKLTTTFWDRR